MATAIPTPTASSVPTKGITPTPVQSASSLGDHLMARTLWLVPGLLAGLGAWLIYVFIKGKR